MKDKKGESLKTGLLVIAASIIISSLALMNSNEDITGYVVGDTESLNSHVSQELKSYDYIDSLKTLAAGNYFIDDSGIVYWTDDPSRPAVGKVRYIYESQKNRQIYIDENGNIGYG